VVLLKIKYLTVTFTLGMEVLPPPNSRKRQIQPKKLGYVCLTEVSLAFMEDMNFIKFGPTKPTHATPVKRVREWKETPSKAKKAKFKRGKIEYVLEWCPAAGELSQRNLDTNFSRKVSLVRDISFKKKQLPKLETFFRVKPDQIHHLLDLIEPHKPLPNTVQALFLLCYS